MRVLRWLIDERLVIGLILLNSLALFMMEASELKGPAWKVWFAIDYGCVVYFVVERILKLRFRGWAAYWKSGWSRFDLIIVILSLPVLVTPFIPGLDDKHHLAGLLILRLGRLFRLFRLLRFVPDRDHVYSGIGRALRASTGVFLAVVLINFILAMGATMLFGDLAGEYFGHPLRSFYSMFQVFTVDGWSEIPRAIDLAAQESGRGMAMGTIARIYFLASVLVGGILGLSLANAVFVDQMTLDNTNTLQDRIENLSDQVGILQAEIRSLAGQLGSDQEPPDHS